MIAAVRCFGTGQTFFFYVGDFPIRADLAVVAGYAATSERSEAEKPDETHHTIPRFAG